MTAQIQALVFKVALAKLDGLPPAIQQQIRRGMSAEAIRILEQRAGPFSLIPMSAANQFIGAAYVALESSPSGGPRFLEWWQEVNRAVFEQTKILNMAIAALAAVALGHRVRPSEILQAAPLMWRAITRDAGTFRYVDTGEDGEGVLELSDAPREAVDTPGFAESWIAAYSVLLTDKARAQNVRVTAEVDKLGRTMRLHCRYTESRRAA